MDNNVESQGPEKCIALIEITLNKKVSNDGRKILIQKLRNLKKLLDSTKKAASVGNKGLTKVLATLKIKEDHEFELDDNYFDFAIQQAEPMDFDEPCTSSGTKRKSVGRPAQTNVEEILPFLLFAPPTQEFDPEDYENEEQAQQNLDIYDELENYDEPFENCYFDEELDLDKTEEETKNETKNKKRKI